MVFQALTLLTGLALAASPVSAETVRVRVLAKYQLRRVEVRSKDGARTFKLDVQQGKIRVREKKGEKLHDAPVPIPVSSGGFYVQIPDMIPRVYKGRLEARLDGDKLVLINTTEMEDYLAGVVAAEAAEIGIPEALKAQAVVSRTFALYERGRHEGYDFCDLTHCQVFHGVEAVPYAVRKAVEFTRGQVLIRNEGPVHAYYHSTCGGETEDGERVWPGEGDHLAGVSDAPGPPAKGPAYCSASPHFRWTTLFSRSQLERLAVRSGWLEPGEALRAFQIVETTPRGRVARLAFIGRKDREVTGLVFFRAAGKNFGWNKVKSTAFVVQDAMDGWKLEGKGLGHGVGFCQWGAQGLARRGAPYREILQHYFPGTRIVGPESAKL